MSWTEILPQARAANTVADVQFAVSKPGRFRQMGILHLRTAAFPECNWLVPGARVKLMLGDGEHTGQLRLTPGGASRITSAAGSAAKTMVRLRSIELRAKLPEAAAHPASPCSYDYDIDWIEITLPDWVGLKKPAPRFSGVMQSGAVAASAAAGSPIPFSARGGK